MNSSVRRVTMAAKEVSRSALKFVVFLGTVREGNYGSRAGKFIVKKLNEKGFQVNFLDPNEIKLPLLERAYHHYKDKSQAPKILQETNQIIADADAYIVITAEYNHSMPPALTNLLDHFPGSSFKYRPAGIVCYSAGQFGGQRAAMQVRCLMAELGTPTTSFLFSIPSIQNNLDQDGNPQNDRMDSGAERLIEELEWYATALRIHRDKYGKPPH